jgi:hypothetical protein
MKQWKAVMAGALLCALAGSAGAQSVLGQGQKAVPPQSGTNPQGQLKVLVVGGVSPVDTSGRALTISSANGLNTTETSPSANNYSYQPSVISGIFISVQDADNVVGIWENRDSTSVIDCRGYNRAALLMFPTIAAAANTDSLAGMLLALQVRAHSGAIADSQSTFRAVTRYFSGSYTTGLTTPRDSIGSLADVIGDDRTVRIGGSQIADSLYKSALPNEQVIVVGNVNNANRGMVIWTGRANEPGASVFPFMSFRLRALQSITRGTGQTPILCPGGAAANQSKSMPMRIRCDLVLWRD